MDVLIFGIVKWIIMTFVILVMAKNYIFLILSPFYPVRERLRYIKQVKLRRAKYLGRHNPRVSVVIPAWNEGKGVIKTLESVLYNGYDNVEVVVVNDGSTDGSDKVIRDYLTRLKKYNRNAASSVNYIYNKHGGKGVALNTGIKSSKGEIILTLDADSALKRGSIKNLTRYFLDKEIMAVVGNVEVVNSNSLIGLAQKLEYFFGFYNKRAHALMGAEYIFGGACASFRKEVFKEIGLFDTKNKTEDIEMSMRTKFHGMKSTYAEDVICYTEGASDLKGLIAQRIRWKKGRFDTFHKYRSMFFSTEDHHNTFLSFFVLPFSLLTEVILFFEPIAIAILIIYMVITYEYLSLSLSLLYILLVFVVVPLFHSKPRPSYILYFPFWPLFYFLDWIEFLACYKSLKMIRQGKDVEWQRWDRQGIHGHLAKENV